MSKRPYPHTIDLCGPWQFTWSPQPIEANTIAQAQAAGLSMHPCMVPGNLELDLQAADVLPEPFFGSNPVQVAQFTQGLYAAYGCLFAAGNVPGDPFLVLEGVDCFAEVFVNGVLASSLDNGLIPHEISISGLLRVGENELFVRFRPALAQAAEHEYPPLLTALPVNYESLYVRKAPHMYGWDIMPRFLSLGLYRPVRIQWRPTRRIEELYLKNRELSADHCHSAQVLYYRLHVPLDGPYDLRVRMACGESVFEQTFRCHFPAGHVGFDLPQPRLWWSKGRGGQNLYDVEVTLLRDGEALDLRAWRHGVRTVELRRTSLTTSLGEGEFVFLLNGEKIYAKGTNWVPLDAFHSRDRDRLDAVFALVEDLNCNMVRCWGGNVYEDDAFYELCDAAGILVWQDFAMACGVYPQDDGFAARLAAEATAVVRRLRSHACLALWSGDNECDDAWRGAHTPTDPAGNRLTRQVLPQVLRQYDGTRPYLPSSPFWDEDAWRNDARYLTEMHLWGPRDYFKGPFYLNALCHFVSEIGYHGCPAPKSVARFISPDKLWPPHNEQWLLHSTSPVPGVGAYDYRVQLMLNQIAELFRQTPDSLTDFAFASQAVQAEAMKFFVERFRMGKWRRTGLLWWNVMDGWPQFSDAVVDYYFVRKLAYYFIRNSQQDIVICLDEPDSWVQNIVVCNDTRRDVSLHVHILDMDSGETVYQDECHALADASTVVAQVPYVRNRQRFLLLRWSGGAQGSNHYLSGQPPFDADLYRHWLRQSGMYDEALQNLNETI